MVMRLPGHAKKRACDFGVDPPTGWIFPRGHEIGADLESKLEAAFSHTLTSAPPYRNEA
jgi:hypothetical protein